MTCGSEMVGSAGGDDVKIFNLDCPGRTELKVDLKKKTKLRDDGKRWFGHEVRRDGGGNLQRVLQKVGVTVEESGTRVRLVL